MRKLLLVLFCQAFVFCPSFAQSQPDSVEIYSEDVYLHDINDIRTVTDSLRLTSIESENISDCQTCRYGILIEASTGLAQSVSIEKSCGNDIDRLAIVMLQSAKYQPLPHDDSPQVTKYFISLPFYFESGAMRSLLYDIMDGNNHFCEETITKLFRDAQERQGNGFLDGPYDEPPSPIGGFNAIRQQLSDLEPFTAKGIEKLILHILVDNHGRVGPYRLLAAVINGQTIQYKSTPAELRGLSRIAFRAVRAVGWRPGTILSVPYPTWVAIPIPIQ